MFSNDNTKKIPYDSKQIQIKTIAEGMYLNYLSDDMGQKMITINSPENKKINPSSFIFQVKRADDEYSQILDRISSINPSLQQFH